MININIEFGGFYDSEHEDRFDTLVAHYFGEDSYVDVDEIDWDSVNFSKTRENYCKQYLIELSEKILDDYDTTVDFKFVELISPKYYNYSTDKLDVEVDSKQMYKLIDKVVDNSNKELLNYIIEGTTNRDGYISYYTKDQVLDNVDNILFRYCLNYIATSLPCIDYENMDNIEVIIH